MIRSTLSLAAWLAVSTASLFAQPAFEVATIKPADGTTGRFLRMQSDNRFVAKAYTVKLLIAAAYDLNSRTISGGPSWVESESYDITAVTPGDKRPTHAEQMLMLRKLLTERFGLTFHREQKEFAIYALAVGKSGPKLTVSKLPADTPPAVGPAVVYESKVVMPSRNATLDDFCQLMQRAILDRPVVNQTGLTARYDFDLDWVPDETQFQGGVTMAPTGTPSPPLFTAIQEQLGLTLKATRGMVAALVIDAVARPSAN
jgi:uncharacterized protein (TIGR03435 family)